MDNLLVIVRSGRIRIQVQRISIRARSGARLGTVPRSGGRNEVRGEKGGGGDYNRSLS